MVKKKTSEIATQFINLQSDYGFKRVFGTERFRPAVIRFLEAALGNEIKIRNLEPHRVEYQDKEVLPIEADGKRIIYDVYFTIKVELGWSDFKPRHILRDSDEKDVEHHFILEMQNIYEPPFEDRMTYYVSKIVSEQGKAGWNYDMDPVILIGVTDFDFPHL